MIMGDWWNPFDNDGYGDWWNPVDLVGGVVKGADWVAMQVPAVVGTTLTAASGGDAGQAWSDYQRNLAVGLDLIAPPSGFTYNPDFPNMGTAIQGGVDLSAAAAQNTLQGLTETVGEAVGSVAGGTLQGLLEGLLKSPLAILAIFGVGYAATRKNAPTLVARGKATYRAVRA